MILLNIALIILSIVGLSLFISGFGKNKQLFILFGVMAFLAPMFWLLGWNFLLPMAPPIALAISLLVRKKESSA